MRQRRHASPPAADAEALGRVMERARFAKVARAQLTLFTLARLSLGRSAGGGHATRSEQPAGCGVRGSGGERIGMLGDREVGVGGEAHTRAPQA